MHKGSAVGQPCGSLTGEANAAEQGQLLILDRSLDMAATLVHEYSYEARISLEIVQMAG